MSNTPPSLRRLESQVLDISSRPPEVLSQGEEYARYAEWLRKDCSERVRINAWFRKQRSSDFRNPVAAEPKFLGINDENKKRR